MYYKVIFFKYPAKIVRQNGYIAVDATLEQYGYYIVNPTDSTIEQHESVTLEFIACNNLVIYTNGRTETVELIEGKYTFDLSAGEGIFLLPY